MDFEVLNANILFSKFVKDSDFKIPKNIKSTRLFPDLSSPYLYISDFNVFMLSAKSLIDR